MSLKWKQLRQEILEALDIREEYEAIGLKVTKEANGKLQCHAIDREDKNASAVVFLDGHMRGRYLDSGRAISDMKRSLSFWDFALKHGVGFKDFNDVVKQYAKKTNLWRKLPKTEDDPSPEDRIDFVDVATTTFAMNVLGFCKAYPGITPQAIIANSLRVGDRVVMANYPKNSPTPALCICLPCYGPGGVNAGPTGYVIMDSGGFTIPLYKGPDAPPEPQKRLCLGNGMVGLRALSNWDDVTNVVKCEGISDFLSLESKLMSEGISISQCSVITNASGAGELEVPKQFAMEFAGKHAFICHDADEPGQAGAEAWCKILLGRAESVRNVKLPFTIEQKKGKDLRDYLCG